MDHFPPLPSHGFATIVASLEPVRREFAVDQATVDNVPFPSTVTLLRLRASDFRAEYVHLFCSYANNVAKPFLCESQEGNGAVFDRVKWLQ